MRAEVQRYKDREKSMQNEDGSAALKKRLSIQQGLYGHGCTSGNVQRGFGLSKEAQARAEANLSRILEFSSSLSEKTTNKKPLAVSLSPKASAEPKIKENHQDVNEIALKDLERPKENKHSSSQREKNAEEDAQVMCSERLAAAARHGIDDKTKYLDSSKKIQALTDKKIMTLIKDCDRSGSSGVTWKIYKLQQERYAPRRKVSKGSKKSSNAVQMMEVPGTPLSNEYLRFTQKQKSPNSQEAAVLRTPLSSDYLKSNSEVRLKDGDVQSQLIQPLAVTSSCPGTTIISPRALLVRYEEKLQKSKCKNPNPNDRSSTFINEGDLILKNVSQNFLKTDEVKEDSYPSRRVQPSQMVEIRSNKKDGVNTEMLISNYRTSQIPSQPGTTKHISTLSSHQRKCPKTVVINPLDYLERCEQQTDNQQIGEVHSHAITKVSTENMPVTSAVTSQAIANSTITEHEPSRYWLRSQIDTHECNNSLKTRKYVQNESNLYKKRCRSALDENCIETLNAWQDEADNGIESGNTFKKKLCSNVSVAETLTYPLDNDSHPVVHPSEFLLSSSYDNIASDSVTHKSKVLVDSCEFMHHPQIYASKTPNPIGSAKTTKHFPHSSQIIQDPISRSEQVLQSNIKLQPNLHGHEQNCITDPIFPISSGQAFVNHHVLHPEYPEHGRTSQTDVAGVCDIGKREIYSPNRNNMSRQLEYQSYNVDTFEEELSKDFVFPTYIQENPGFYQKSLMKAGRRGEHEELLHLQSRGNITSSNGVECSSRSNSSNSTSQSSSQDLLGSLSGYHHGSQNCLESYLHKQNKIDKTKTCDTSSLQRTMELNPQHVQVLGQPPQTDDHRFYRRKLY